MNLVIHKLAKTVDDRSISHSDRKKVQNDLFESLFESKAADLKAVADEEVVLLCETLFRVRACSKPFLGELN